MRIMIVDDDSEILEILTGFVNQFLGHDCLAVSSVSAALERLETFNPHIIITDYSMPGQNGIELIRAVKEKAPHVSVIMLSAESKIGIAVDAMRMGAEDYLSKPTNVDEIESVIKRVQSKWDSLPTAAEVEQRHIEVTVAHFENVAKAAEKLGVNASTIWRKKAKAKQAA